MSEIAEKAGEKAGEVTAEVVEDSIDGVDVVEVVRNNPVALVAVGVIAGVAGGVGGYFIAKKRLKSYYEDLADQEIQEAKDFYARVNKVGPDGHVLTPKEVMMERHSEPEAIAAAAVAEYQGRPDPLTPAPTEADLIAAAKDEQGTPADDALDEATMARLEARAFPKEETVEEEIARRRRAKQEPAPINVFSDPQFDLEEEMKYRTDDKPYVITHDEFYEADKEYDNIELAYFEKDDTVIDERDQPMDDTDNQIGDDNLVRFGHGSKDRNIVFVRNDKLQTDYEITRHEGSWLEHLGLGPEPDGVSIKHSAQQRRAFRHGDG